MAARENIEREIEQISAELKNPGLTSLDRLMLHDDRKDLRRILYEMDTTNATSTP